MQQKNDWLNQPFLCYRMILSEENHSLPRKKLPPLNHPYFLPQQVKEHDKSEQDHGKDGRGELFDVLAEDGVKERQGDVGQDRGADEGFELLLPFEQAQVEQLIVDERDQSEHRNLSGGQGGIPSEPSFLQSEELLIKGGEAFDDKVKCDR